VAEATSARRRPGPRSGDGGFKVHRRARQGEFSLENGSASAPQWLQSYEQSLHSSVSMKTKPAREPRLRPRMRVLCGEDIALGPGKVDLLALIGETGSIREAAERMGMSYMRAWTLVKTVNACFREPLVMASRGGKERGGAVLTETGRRALKLYQELEVQSLKACSGAWRQLRQLLAD